ncbi:MAG TPA: hypothetical protein V6C72_06860 [Chroococcales cyanobacterium]
MAKSDNVELRVAVANHTNTPQEVLSLLAQDDHTDVKFAIADNQNSDPHVLGTLCEHSDPLISDRAERTLVRICEAGQVESSSKSTSV